LQNTFIIDADIKKENYYNEPKVTANDDITFVVNITDDGLPFDLTDVITVSLANTRHDKQTIVTTGEKTGSNQVTFVLGTSETAISGKVKAVVQLYDADERVSTLSFSYKVEKDPTGDGFVPSETEQTLIQTVLGDGPLIIEEAQTAADYANTQGDYALQVAVDNETRFLNAVDTVTLRDSTYPNPAHGDTVRVTSTATTYRYVSGTGWVITDVYNPTAIDEVTAQLAETVQQIENASIDIEQYPRLTLEVTDSPRIQRAIDDLVNKKTKIITFPKLPFDFSTTVTVKTGVKLFAYGALFRDLTTHRKMLNLESSTSIFGLEIEGAGATSTDGGRGINIEGTLSAYKKDILIEDCYIHDVGFYGIFAEFAENVQVNRCWVKNIGYGAIVGLSVKNMNVDKALIKNISPGQNTNSYGVGFSRQQTFGLDVFPRSVDCSVTNTLIEDVVGWEGLDTHAGENIKFDNNTTRNCKVGIAVVASGSDFASRKCTITNNTIFGTGSGSGIVVAGAGAILGSPVQPADACIVRGNTIINGGSIGNTNNGGIRIVATEGIIVSGNSLKDCYETGICIDNTNKGFVITDNVIVDTQSASSAASANIGIRSDYNTGVIANNTLLLINASLNTYVSQRGISSVAGANNNITIGHHFNTSVIKAVGAEGQTIKYGSIGIGGSEVYSGLGSPEGVITATIGSLFISRNGSAGTTLFVKESGTGSTGWVGK